jgi:hypothetical protein
LVPLKAERLARQISEYRRRGRLIDGDTLVRDVSTISAVAVEPRMGVSLPWLDPTNADDRFLASALEICARTSERLSLSSHATSTYRTSWSSPDYRSSIRRFSSMKRLAQGDSQRWSEYSPLATGLSGPGGGDAE